MITKLEDMSTRAQINGVPVPHIEYRGLSTDAKPIDAGNGDVFFEMNTGKVFLYNKAGSAWVEV